MRKVLTGVVAVALFAAGCGGSSGSEEPAQVQAELDASKEQVVTTTGAPATTVVPAGTQAPTTTVAPTTVVPTTTMAPSQKGSYTVQSGDSCWSIADSMCKDGNSWDKVICNADSVCKTLQAGATVNYDCSGSC